MNPSPTMSEQTEEELMETDPEPDEGRMDGDYF